jgi:hypothetical protein
VASAGSSLSQSQSTGATAPTVLVNGITVSPGSPVINVPTAGGIRPLVVQIGPGNAVMPSATDIRDATTATLIQNTLNNQTIRSTTLMNVQLGLSRTMSAASIQDAVRQGMVTSGR